MFEWGSYKSVNLNYSGPIIEVARNERTGLISGFYYNGRKKNGRITSGSSCNIVMSDKTRYKLVNRLKRLTELMTHIGISSPHRYGSWYFEKKDKSKELQQEIAQNIDNSSVIRSCYAKKISYCNFKDECTDKYSDRISVLLNTRDNLELQNTDQESIEQEKIILTKKINKLKLKSVCNSIGNNKQIWYSEDGESRKEHTLYVAANTYNNEGSVLGYVITKRYADNGKMIITIRSFDNTDNEAELNFNIVGEFVVNINSNKSKLKKYLKNNYIKKIILQFSNPSFIDFISAICVERKQLGMNTRLDLSNKNDFFVYLACFEENLNHIDPIDYLLIDKSVIA